MSAKHKRPFYVFAAVAAICCVVLVTGIREAGSSSGSGTGENELAGAELNGAGEPIGRRAEIRLAKAVDARLREATLGSPAGGPADGSGPASTGDTEPPRSTPDADETGDPPVPESGDIEGEPTDNIPDTDDPVDDGDDPPVATRPPGDEDEAGDEEPTEEETEQEADSDGDPDDPGPLDETEDPDGTDDPSDEGAGMDTDEAPDEGQGQGEDQN